MSAAQARAAVHVREPPRGSRQLPGASKPWRDVRVWCYYWYCWYSAHAGSSSAAHCLAIDGSVCGAAAATATATGTGAQQWQAQRAAVARGRSALALLRGMPSGAAVTGASRPSSDTRSNAGLRQAATAARTASAAARRRRRTRWSRRSWGGCSRPQTRALGRWRWHSAGRDSAGSSTATGNSGWRAAAASRRSSLSGRSAGGCPPQQARPPACDWERRFKEAQAHSGEPTIVCTCPMDAPKCIRFPRRNSMSAGGTLRRRWQELLFPWCVPSTTSSRNPFNFQDHEI